MCLYGFEERFPREKMASHEASWTIYISVQGSWIWRGSFICTALLTSYGLFIGPSKHNSCWVIKLWWVTHAALGRPVVPELNILAAVVVLQVSRSSNLTQSFSPQFSSSFQLFVPGGHFCPGRASSTHRFSLGTLHSLAAVCRFGKTSGSLIRNFTLAVLI